MRTSTVRYKILVAARLSKSRAGQTGIDTQDIAARQWAEREGHEVVDVVADRISGRTSPFDRPNLGPWLTRPDLMARYTAVLASKIDRFTRGRDWRMRTWAEENDKTLIVVSPEMYWPPKKGDSTTPILWDTLVNVASGEWEATSERYSTMLGYLKSQGYLSGRHMWWYEAVPHPDNPERKTLVLQREFRRVLHHLVDQVIAGDKMADIVRWLSAEGVPTQFGAPWSGTAVRQILTNPILVGRHTDLSGRTIMRVDPEMSAERWAELQRALEARPRNRPRKSEALLSGRLVCFNGHPIYPRDTWRKRKDGSRRYHRYYGCLKGCVNVRADEADAFVTRLYALVWGDQERTKVTVIPGTGYEAEIALVEEEIRALDLDDPSFLAKQGELREERRRLRETPAAPDRTEEVGTGERMADWWQEASPVGRRGYLEEHGVYFIVYGKGQYRWASTTQHADRDPE